MSDRPTSLDPHTLEMLVCPLSKTRLALSENGEELISVVARLAYPVRDGIAMMVIDEARAISEEEAAAHSR